METKKDKVLLTDNFLNGYISDSENAEYIETEDGNISFKASNGCYLKRIENGEISDTTDDEKAEQLIPQCRAKLNASTKNEIAQGCEYEGKILPITDDWEAKYLAMEKSYADGNTDSITIDTLDNTTFPGDLHDIPNPYLIFHQNEETGDHILD